MNLSPDALDRALNELASRADSVQSPDRVPAVHRRARRAAVVRAASVGGTLVAVVAVVAITLGGGVPFTRADSVPAHRASKPFLTVALASQPKLAAGLPDNGQSGVPAVVQVTIHGLVPQMSNAAGEPASGTDNLLMLRMYWDPRGYNGATSTEYHCVPGAPLVRVDSHFLMTGYYGTAGTYPIQFRTAACGRVGKVSKAMNLTLR